MPHSYTNLLYHFVFSTKGRRALLTPNTRAELCPYLAGAVRGEGGDAVSVQGTADHVHILARLRQDKALADVLRNIKANSSKWLHQRFADQQSFAWQQGYGAFTVSESQSGKVRRYIEGQEDHHRKTTFQDEFTALLKAHGIAFDPRFIWE
ncbi:MAG TPA: IS200/IS605 family transposase [Phycisphaerae bacterium]|nr:IS200/IS605 family transposase [Phycisphaerae bacterium]